MGLAQITKLPSAGRGILTQVPYSRAWAPKLSCTPNWGWVSQDTHSTVEQGQRRKGEFSHITEISCTLRIKYSLKLTIWDILVLIIRHRFYLN